MIVGALATGQTTDTKVVRPGFDLYTRLGRRAAGGDPERGAGFRLRLPDAGGERESQSRTRRSWWSCAATGRSRPSVISPETINLQGYLEDLEALRTAPEAGALDRARPSAGGLLAMH